jgi:hypothetical protein
MDYSQDASRSLPRFINRFIPILINWVVEEDRGISQSERPELLREDVLNVQQL